MLASCLASVAHATSMVRMDLEEQAEESTAFVDARVGDSHQVDGDRFVYTDTELVISDVLSGTAPRTLVVRQVGGTVDGRTTRVPGDARLTEDERILAFVRKVDGRWYFTLLGQSVWHVAPDGTLTPGTDPSHLLERGPTGAVRPATESAPWFASADDLSKAARHLHMGGLP